MGLRESIDKRPKTMVGVILGVGILALGVSFYSLRDDTASPQTKAYYTDDDGKTWFADSIDRVSPFDHDGKTAVMVKLFTCDDRKSTFVGYLERYTPAIKKRLDASEEAVAAGRRATLTQNSMEVVMGGTEVKRPGDKVWVGNSNMQAKQKIMNVTCPPGGLLDSVLP